MATINVWDALADNPGHSKVMQARSALMREVTRKVKSWDGTQAAASERLGVTQPRLNDLLTGKIDKFSIDAMIRLCASAGLEVNLEINVAVEEKEEAK